MGADHSNASGGNRETKSLMSAGLGAHWRFSKNWSVGLNWGKMIDSDFDVRDDNQFYFNIVRLFAG